MIVLMGTWMTWLQWLFEPPSLCTPMAPPRTAKIPSLLERRPSASTLLLLPRAPSPVTEPLLS
jgi:hypothetical protein